MFSIITYETVYSTKYFHSISDFRMSFPLIKKKNIRFRTAEQRSKSIEKQIFRDLLLREFY